MIPQGAGRGKSRISAAGPQLSQLRGLQDEGPGFRHFAESGLFIARVQADCAAAISQHGDLESEFQGVQNAELNAVIRSEARNGDLPDIPVVQERPQTGLVPAVHVEKGAVAVHRPQLALPDDRVSGPHIEVGVEAGAGRFLDTVVRPHDLVDASQADDVAGFRARVVGGEAGVIGGVPVLGEHDEGPVVADAVDERHHVVSILYPESASGAEVVLYVHDHERLQVHPPEKETAGAVTGTSGPQVLKNNTAAVLFPGGDLRNTGDYIVTKSTISRTFRATRKGGPMSALDRMELEVLFAETREPCVSIYLPTHRAGPEIQQDSIRFKNLLRTTEDRLRADGMDKPAVDRLAAPARALLEDPAFWRHQSDGLAVFMSPDLFRSHNLPLDFNELVVVSQRFHLKPILPLLSGNGLFYVLALSQNDVRLFEADRVRARAVPLPDVPRSLADALGHDWKERSLQFRTRGGPARSGGSGEAAFHGHGIGVDDSKEEIGRFLRLVDDGVVARLGDSRAPMVVAAVDYVTAIFRNISRYPNILETGIQGNPDGVDGARLHAKAWKIVRPVFQESRERAAARCRERLGTGLAGQNLEEVVLASLDGRVESLFVALGSHSWGRIDEAARRVEARGRPVTGDYDLLDAAAVQCYLHEGSVYAVEPSEVPGGGTIAAVYRY